MKLKVFLFALIGIILVSITSSCSKEDDNVVPSVKNVMYVGDTFTIKNGGRYLWSSKYPLVASVEGSVVTAHHVGETTISCRKFLLKVVVKAKSNLYEEPFFLWGASKSTIKSLSAYSLQGETSTGLSFWGKYPVELYMYLFKNNMMNCSAALLPGNYAEQVVDFLTERYVYVDKVDDIYSFCSLDKKMIIGLSVYVDNNYDTHCMVMYTPANSDVKTRNTSNMFDEFKKLSKEIIK